jgi:hypothetical protein
MDDRRVFIFFRPKYSPIDEIIQTLKKIIPDLIIKNDRRMSILQTKIRCKAPGGRFRALRSIHGAGRKPITPVSFYPSKDLNPYDSSEIQYWRHHHRPLGIIRFFDPYAALKLGTCKIAGI